MHQSQKTTMIHKCCARTSRPHCLKKTYSKQSKRRDLHLVTLSWDNRSNLIYIINIKTLMLLLFYKNKQTMNLKLLSGAWEGSARKTESKVHERNQVRQFLLEVLTISSFSEIFSNNIFKYCYIFVSLKQSKIK